MEKEENYHSASFPTPDYSQTLHHQIGENSGGEEGFILNNTADFHRQPPMDYSVSFADVMQFADFGSKLALNQTRSLINYSSDQDRVLGDSMQVREYEEEEEEEDGIRVSENKNELMDQRNRSTTVVKSSRKKRARTTKTSEEVESQRKTHIAVERNRRRQMNDHLRVLRALMPSSYVQRGDQASIIGGAIEFVRELEQLLQCLESQKRRRLYGDVVPDPIKLVDTDQSTGFREDVAEAKSCLADVEVKVLGFDAMIKILSKRRPGQLLKTIAGLEDLQLNILHTNITTIDHTVLYSFNVKISSETRFTAEDIANSAQQIFRFIHANTNSSILSLSVPPSGPQPPTHVQLAI